MRCIHRILPFVLLIAPLAWAAEPPVDQDGRPLIKKLGTIAVDIVENSPVVFHDKLYIFMGRHDFHFVEHDTGRKTPSFTSGYFGNAFVDGDTMYVTVASAGPQVTMYTSKDLEHWQSQTALDLPGYKIYNTSICKAGDTYVMMFEIGEPREEAGHAFTARFATSKDLKHWAVTPPECNYAKDRYTAPHALRWLDGYYYDFYLEAIRGEPYESHGYEMYVVRSKDLIHWEKSPLNPVLRASDEDRRLAAPDFSEEQRQRIATAKNLNNSDIDFCEYQGRVIIVYSWGNQTGVEHLAEAVYEGSVEDFLRGWFPERSSRRPVMKR
jgi:hypothetical protein